MTDIKNSDLQLILSLDEEDLFELLGKELSTGRGRLVPLTRNKAIEYGRRWFESNFMSIKNQVCSNKQIKQIAAEQSNDYALIIAIADLLTSIVIGVAPITVASLIIKKGLKQMCAENWDFIENDLI